LPIAPASYDARVRREPTRGIKNIGAQLSVGQFAHRAMRQLCGPHSLHRPTNHFVIHFCRHPGPNLGLKPIHSSLSAIIGSIFAARQAGMKQATAATHTSNNDTAANVSGSVDF
jgi:hypothetical protein